MARVAILGGGVAGMSAAHELVERGFTVDVYEQRGIPGGKARGIPVPGSGTGGRPDFPGEHGFRFFPGFYKHLPDTMKRIPFAGNAHGVYDNLVQATEYLIASNPLSDLKFLVRFPASLSELAEALKGVFSSPKLGIPLDELEFFIGRLLIILTSCQERRLGQFEEIPWWQFIHANSMSEAYQTYLARGLTRSLVAMRAEIASTRTVGDILIQLILDLYNPLVEFDRVLNGPTNDAWLTPWSSYLASRGVNFHLNYKVKSINCMAGHITSATVTRLGPPPVDEEVVADYYIAALPVEQMAGLVTPLMAAADPTLNNLMNLQVAWMNGIQFFLKDTAAFAHGHVLFATSAWSLTAISQAQFWGRPVSAYGDGTATGVLSVDISDWDSPGIVYGEPAMGLNTREKIKIEVLAQMRNALTPELGQYLDDSNIAAWFLDSDIQFPSGAASNVNLEPLLINVTGSWQYRPEAVTRISNFFLASDYVRTYTDLATMEGANEAARRAVNGILSATRSTAPPCALYPLVEPLVFAPLRELDKLRYDAGLPHVTAGDVIDDELARALRSLVPAGPAGSGPLPSSVQAIVYSIADLLEET